MKIDKAFENLLSDIHAQIEFKFNISIGYSCPHGSFIDYDNDFVLYRVNDDDVYLIEYNPEFHDISGIMCRYVPDLNAPSAKVDLLVKQINEWIEKEEITIYEKRFFKNYEWKPCGNGKFSVKIKYPNHVLTFIKDIDEISKYPDLKEHILQEMKNE